VPPVTWSPWRGVLPDLAGRQVLFLLGVTGLGLGLVARSCLRSWKTRGWLSVAGTVTLLAVISLLRAAPPVDAELYGFTARDLPEPGAPAAGGYQPVCSAAAVPVCIHPAFTPLLPDISPPINAMLAPIVGLPGVPTRIELLPLPDPEAAVDTWSTRLDGHDAETDLIRALHLLAESVLTSGGTAPLNAASDADGARRVVAAWLVRSAGRPLICTAGVATDRWEGGSRGVEGVPCETFEWFAGLDPAVRTAWLREHWYDLRAGLIGVQELPAIAG
jgi:hypothetical protein